MEAAVGRLVWKGETDAQVNAKHGRPWSPSEVKQLKDLAGGNTPTRVIGLKLGRTEDVIRGRASSERISLKPTNQSPYNRRKK
jgi:hypothetical protein